ncbi:MAG: FkbM family methyltransferase [Candidatus Anstonellales archaeon]
MFGKAFFYIKLFLSAQGVGGKIETLLGIIRSVFSYLFYGFGSFHVRNPVVIKISDIFYKVPVFDASIASVNIESNSNKIVSEIVSILNQTDKEYFIDIGANLGSVSLFVAKKFKGKKVIAVEPVHWLADSLRESSKLNNLKNYEVVNNAISHSKHVELSIPVINGVYFTTVASSVPNKKFKKFHKLKVRGTTLSGLLKALRIKPDDIALIKVDVEGLEEDVLLSGVKELKKAKPPVIFEAWNSEKLGRITEILSKLGYRKYRKIEEDDYVAT